ncbi:MAG: flagellar hook-length control protein FliK, partial [Candidatus Desantisbacteria bacterium]
ARTNTIDTVEVIEPVPVAMTQAQPNIVDTTEAIKPMPAVVIQARMNTIDTAEVIEPLPAVMTQAQPSTIDTAEAIEPMPAVVTQVLPNTIDMAEAIEPAPVAINQPDYRLPITDYQLSVPVAINQPQLNTINTVKTTEFVPITMNQPQLNTVGTTIIDHDMKVMDKIKEGIERILFRNNNATNINMGMGNEQAGTSFNTHNEPLMEETSTPTAWQNHSDTAKEIINKLIQEIRINLKDEVTQMHIQLKPEYLGELDIMFSMKEGGLDTTFWVQSTQIKELIESNLGMLRNTLGALGMGMNLINVFVKDENSWDKQKREESLSFGPRSLKEKKRQINIDIANIPMSWRMDAGVIDFVA